MAQGRLKCSHCVPENPRDVAVRLWSLSGYPTTPHSSASALQNSLFRCSQKPSFFVFYLPALLGPACSCLLTSTLPHGLGDSIGGQGTLYSNRKEECYKRGIVLTDQTAALFPTTCRAGKGTLGPPKSPRELGQLENAGKN